MTISQPQTVLVQYRNRSWHPDAWEWDFTIDREGLTDEELSRHIAETLRERQMERPNEDFRTLPIA